jgi:hypothetical protein
LPPSAVLVLGIIRDFKFEILWVSQFEIQPQSRFLARIIHEYAVAALASAVREVDGLKIAQQFIAGMRRRNNDRSPRSGRLK